MDDIEFHGEPPSNIPTMVVAFGGWVDAGEAATGALRSLVRQLAATPLATIDPEDVRRLYHDPACRAPERRGGAHDPLAADRVLDLAAPRWRCRAAALSRRRAPAAVAHIRDPAPGRGRALWGAADRVAGGGPRGRAAYPAPTCHGQQHRSRLARTVGGVRDTDPALALRRPDRHEHGRRGCGDAPGLSALTVRGQAPHYLGDATNPAVRRALLTAVARLLDLELDVTPFEAAVRAFRTQCDQAVAQDAAVQAYVRQLEQDYDAPGDEAPHPRRDEDFNPEQLMHELEDFLRQEREGRGD